MTSVRRVYKMAGMKKGGNEWWKRGGESETLGKRSLVGF